MRTGTQRAGIAGLLLLSMAVVLIAGGVTAWIVASILGPVIFSDHMGVVGMPSDALLVLHAEEAFRASSGASLAVALTGAGVASLGVSYFLTRRIGRSTRVLSSAAMDIAGGHFNARVQDPRLGVEFVNLTAAFNEMAAGLDQSRNLRRRLLSDIAHELRTPVAAIMAYLDAIEDGVEELTPETVFALRAQGTRLARLADDLAAVTQAESSDLNLHRAPTDITGLIEQVVAGFTPQFREKEVLLEVAAFHETAEVMIDPERLHQVLANLLENALRYTPRGGRVAITSRIDSAGVVEVVIADTGIGLDPVQLPLVFERFYRADTARDRRHGGSGIGLAIVKALIEAHGGAVRVESGGIGHGTRFILSLPATQL